MPFCFENKLIWIGCKTLLNQSPFCLYFCVGGLHGPETTNTLQTIIIIIIIIIAYSFQNCNSKLSIMICYYLPIHVSHKHKPLGNNWMFCQLVAICVALTLELSKMTKIRLAWSWLAMYGKWMDQLLPLMMQANFEHYFNNELWLTFIWLILLSFLLDDRGHFSKCHSFSSSAV